MAALLEEFVSAPIAMDPTPEAEPFTKTRASAAVAEVLEPILIAPPAPDEA